MSAQAQTIEVPTDAELLQAQADLWRHSLYYLSSMGLRCAVELEIPTAIHRLGGAASLPDLMSALSLPSVKMPFLRRVMRVLVTSGVFAADNDSGSEAIYRLTPLSRILVHGVVADEHHSQKYFVIGVTSPHYTEAAMGLAGWFKKDHEPPVPSPFEDIFGVPLCDDRTPLLDKELDDVVTQGLAAHDNLGIATVMRECHDLFKGLDSLTDCGGGDGTTARAIIKAYPHIKCTVLDLPKVVDKAPEDGLVTYVAGPIMFEAQLLMDMLMMVNSKGRQRDENDWSKPFTKAGFTDYKIVKKLGARCVIELLPSTGLDKGTFCRVQLSAAAALGCPLSTSKI
ncbi:putative O-methyltransferase 2 [Triticum urartu]|uniref:Putative O-methyltransferase 2 n=1 Tax=Triticum urartu TaxID=4572 RepID=M7ZDM5_TRIUA|nr:putative O-methyltransferase 2 [Triticum urartu]